MNFSEVQFAGFQCIQIDHAGLQMIVTTDVGPRVLSFCRAGSFNHFYVKKEHEGLRDGLYHSYGGHRLWIAPEDKVRTYTPDSFPVAFREDKGALNFRSVTDSFGITKSMRVSWTPHGFQIDHWFSNTGPDSARFAPWAVTVLRAGGTLSVPLHRLRPQAENLLPVTPLILWGYTDLTDERFDLSGELLRLRQLPIEAPTKFGAFIEPGIAAYSNGGETFVKSWKSNRGDEFADFGCNFESYTRHDMLEVESLGPLQDVRPGESSLFHTEFWSIENEEVPSDRKEARVWLLDRAGR